MKSLADKRRTDMVFDIGTWVYVKLQPHSTARIHPVFHVSQLKEYKGVTPVLAGQLPAINEDGLIAELPIKLLERKMLKKGNRAVVYGLIQWQNGSIEDATWEPLEELMLRFPAFTDLI
ncbi:uncharacterized protein [Rutidosis leptorrhynchoides]|uniref:uncharacterized protein n=1 Tax=Rutidosis leptorrhynchoides TaxID=125765 RepID=UPI003A9A394A